MELQYALHLVKFVAKRVFKRFITRVEGKSKKAIHYFLLDFDDFSKVDNTEAIELHPKFKYSKKKKI